MPAPDRLLTTSNIRVVSAYQSRLDELALAQVDCGLAQAIRRVAADAGGGDFVQRRIHLAHRVERLGD